MYQKEIELNPKVSLYLTSYWGIPEFHLFDVIFNETYFTICILNFQITIWKG